MMPKTWFWCAVSLVLAGAPAADAATVLEKTVAVNIQPDGVVREHTHLAVRLDTAGDVESWSTYPIYLDENRSLEQVDAYSIQPDGKRVKVGRKDRDTRELSGESLHASRSFHLLSFRGLAVGSMLVIDHDVEVEPYYPAGGIPLTLDDPAEKLEVAVTGDGDGWRWRIDGPAERLKVEETPSGVIVTGSNLPKVDPPELAPGGAAVRPVLRYAWDGDGSWQDVGSWYTALLSSVPRGAAPVRRQARELIAGIEGKRERLEALLGFMRRKVRYVAVEVGIGGYRPSPPEEVLARMWGDCKDKALLFVDLLKEAGIEAHPALILASRNRRIDRRFPSPGQFNHVIVAVPAGAVPLGDDDPIGDGFLFLDPTQTRGAARWLHPANQDHDVLVVRAGGATLAHTPTRPRPERRRLVVELTVTPQGDGLGVAGLTLSGYPATYFIEQLSSAPPERTEEDVRSIFANLLPGVTLKRLGWAAGAGEVPTVDMAAEVTIEGMIKGLDSRPSFQLPGMRATPEPRLIADREIAMVLRPSSTEITWQITLPDGWCPPKVGEQRVGNDLGVFYQAIAHRLNGQVVIDRKIELRQRWIEPEMLPALKELALAEHRARRRRIRLECEDSAGVVTGSPGSAPALIRREANTFSGGAHQ